MTSSCRGATGCSWRVTAASQLVQAQCPLSSRSRHETMETATFCSNKLISTSPLSQVYIQETAGLKTILLSTAIYLSSLVHPHTILYTFLKHDRLRTFLAVADSRRSR